MQNMTVILRVLKIMVGIIFSHLPVGVIARSRGVEGDTLLYIKWKTRRIRAAFGHSSGSPEALWPILLPLTPLFWVTNVSVTNVAA